MAVAQPVVLVVDDAADSLALLSGLLRPHYRVKVANNGERALQVAGAEPPDLILLDVDMPGMDGYEVCRQLKANPLLREVPVVFLTARDEADDERLGLELGAVDYMTKPVKSAILLVRVRNHLALKALRDAQTGQQRLLQQEKALVQMEQRKTEQLMLNILPAPIAQRLRQGEQTISGAHPAVTILFSDLVGFTAFAARCTATELVRLLNDLFTRFDLRAQRLGLEKIKTIGDAYMAAAGVPAARPDHAQACAAMALGMVEDLAAFNQAFGLSLDMRVGLHSGPLVAGVIGFTKFAYDLWGHTVNVASRMESTAPVGRIQVSQATHDLLAEGFRFESPAEVDCKGIGPVRTWLLAGVAGPS